jgi:hypothetical protein
MTDETYGQREARRRAQEFTEFDNDLIAKAIDYWWELKLARRVRRGVEEPDRGIYDPIERFERES